MADYLYCGDTYILVEKRRRERVLAIGFQKVLWLHVAWKHSDT
jgi:hypothetical protein